MRTFLSKVASTFVLALLVGCGSVNVGNLNEDDFPNVEGGNSCSSISASFAEDVAPIFSKSIGGTVCSNSGCHNLGTSSGGLNLDVVGSNIDTVHTSILDGRVDLNNPGSSLILQKPLGIPSHTGGKIFSDTNDSDYRTIFCWIEAGALNN